MISRSDMRKTIVAVIVKTAQNIRYENTGPIFSLDTRRLKESNRMNRGKIRKRASARM